jgi:cell division protein FtsA
MANNSKNNLRVGIDIGTSKVVCIIAENTSEGINVLGLGIQNSIGLRDGVIVDIESTVAAVKEAVSKAELMSGRQVTKAFVGISGGSVNGLNSSGAVPIKDKKVKMSEVEKVMSTAQAQRIPEGYELLHALPREFIIDNQPGVKAPLGMAGVRLEAHVHLVSCLKNSATNIGSCMKICGIDVQKYVLEQLASSHSVLTDDQKKLGVCLIDIGGGTSDVAIFSDGAISHTVNVPIAGTHVTNDIARAIQTSIQNAEDIKKKHGCAWSELADSDEMITTQSINGRENQSFSRHGLSTVIEERYQEIFQIIKQRMGNINLAQAIPAGIVLTGGASRIEGISQLAEAIFQAPVRVGKPQGLIGLSDILSNPIYSTAVGLILFAQKEQEEDYMDFAMLNEKGLLNKAFRWIQNTF